MLLFCCLLLLCCCCFVVIVSMLLLFCCCCYTQFFTNVFFVENLVCCFVVVVLVLLFCLWHLMTTYANLWQLMTTYGNIRQLMASYGNLWYLMATYGYLLQISSATCIFWSAYLCSRCYALVELELTFHCLCHLVVKKPEGLRPGLGPPHFHSAKKHVTSRGMFKRHDFMIRPVARPGV